MRRLVIPLVLLSVLCVVGQPLTAQVDLTDERTAEQKWSRMIYMANFMFTGYLAHGESLGQSPEEMGRFFGEFAARSWGGPGSMTLQAYVRQTFLNNSLWPDLEFEILTETEEEIRFKMNLPWVGYFGEDRMAYGVSMEAFNEAWFLANEGIADSLGFDMTHELQGDWVQFSVKAG